MLRNRLKAILRELSVVADGSGLEIWKVYEAAGISGAKARDHRPGLDAMMKAVNAREFHTVTCHRTFIQQQLESQGFVRRLARLEQRAIGGAGRGCAADRPLR
jgi:DNA invertase Pin-like site-specific DNA recombinase